MYCLTVYFVTIYACLFVRKQLYLNFKPSFSFFKKVIFHTTDKCYCPKPGKVVKYVCPYLNFTSAIQYSGYLIVWPAHLLNWYIF